MKKRGKKRERDIMDILNCIAVRMYGRSLAEKISVIEEMEYQDDVKKEAIERLKKGSA